MIFLARRPLLLSYHLQYGLLSLRRNALITILMILAIGIGIGAVMTTLTVFLVVSKDPMPDSSGRIFHPRMDAQDMAGFSPNGEPHDLMTRQDAEQLLREKQGVRQALMAAGSVIVEPPDNAQMPFRQRIRYTSADFFPMFQVPLAQGQVWTAADDQSLARVVVLGEVLANSLFPGANSIGKILRLNGVDFRIVGVIGPWEVHPKFYDLSREGGFSDSEQIFIPFSTSRELRMGTAGSITCWGGADTQEGRLGVNSPCAWVQYWVELASAADADAYIAYLENYSALQRRNGRFQRPVNVRLDNITSWLKYKRVVPSDVRLQTWLAAGFLFICLLNTTGLLLAKFLRRAPEIGLRRALGAPRSAVFLQCLVEAGIVGIAGGLAGLLFAWIGLWAVRQQSAGHAHLAMMNASTLVWAVTLSILATLIAGSFPAWRACRIAPASQLKNL
ncbi:ABC transporter permease [Xanthomonas sp. 4461]|uniref:ABC transporter permease n=1 Tax=Xanthomonas sp. 4461 TaxID=3035313 RepID=UPI002168111F|nr:ABC transporter permease [Xanthomonas sp. 4461]MCS3809279.1 putative ABC transport system permease protein [Xanthomonas sp. 4461]